MELVIAIVVAVVIVIGAYFLYFKKLFDDTNNCFKTETLYSIKKYDTNCFKVSQGEVSAVKKYIESSGFTYSIIGDDPTTEVVACDRGLKPVKYRQAMENSLKAKADVAIGKRFEMTKNVNYKVRFDDGKIIISNNKRFNDAVEKNFM